MDLASIETRVSQSLNISPHQSHSILKLHLEGSTVPFMARYRKEVTHNADEELIRSVIAAYEKIQQLETRRESILESLTEQNVLSPELSQQIWEAKTLTQLEELYRPYKRKVKTKGALAREAGLGDLAPLLMTASLSALEKALRERCNAPQNTLTYPEILQGVLDIVSEIYSQSLELRNSLKSWLLKMAILESQGVGSPEAEAASVYRHYWKFQEAFSRLRPHQILALERGEKEKQLKVQISTENPALIENRWLQILQPPNLHAETAAKHSLKKTLFPSLVREIWSEALEKAENHSLEVFATNLKNLLMQPPLQGRKILSIDPGLRTGSKCTVLDSTGTYLDSFILDPWNEEKSIQSLKAQKEKHQFQLVALGSGTGSKEIQKFLVQIPLDFCLVDEDGASVYSASPLAKKELPGLDVTYRGAVSIGRRLLDPLAELVKIDPASLGVGQYQHDLAPAKLRKKLDTVVESAVNQVGVLVNSSSPSLLSYVSGIGSVLAEKIVSYRVKNGPIRSREELWKIPGVGPKIFEQAAGFLKIPESKNPLDNTWVHPENYELAQELLPLLPQPPETIKERLSQLQKKYGKSQQEIQEILGEIRRPSRDPRLSHDAPPIRSEALELENLKPGDSVSGRIKNVVDFGAFVDIGIKESALIHVSEMSDQFVKDPHTVLKVGDTLNFTILEVEKARRRISLTLKKRPSEKS